MAFIETMRSILDWEWPYVGVLVNVPRLLSSVKLHVDLKHFLLRLLDLLPSTLRNVSQLWYVDCSELFFFLLIASGSAKRFFSRVTRQNAILPWDLRLICLAVRDLLKRNRFPFCVDGCFTPAGSEFRRGSLLVWANIFFDVCRARPNFISNRGRNNSGMWSCRVMIPIVE